MAKLATLDSVFISRLKKELASKSFESNQHAQKIKEASQSFLQTGIPSVKNEEWKYTNLSTVIELDFQEENKKIDKETVQKLFFPFEANHLVIINGEFNEAFSILPSTEFIITRIKELDEEVIQQYFARQSKTSQDGLSLLNTAFAENGLALSIPKNKSVSKPIIIYYINNCQSVNTFAQPRTLILANENTSCSIIESFHAIGNLPNFTNCITELVLQENANVDYYKIQVDQKESYHVGTTEIYHEAKSYSSATTITLGGILTRNNLTVSLNAASCEAYLNGLFYADGNQHIDNHTVANHIKPNCYSNELYKGIMDGSSTGVFNGKIFVQLDAQKTNAFQSNKNILLSNTASINTKPQLEIFADDVKCSHGTTTGQLEEEALFYLRSRGIGEEDAKKFLLHAFANDVIARIKIEPLRAFILAITENRLS